MKIQKRMTALLSAAMMLATSTPSTALVVHAIGSSDKIKVVAVPNTIEYKKNDYSYLTKYGSNDCQLTFSAARNERESGQLMIYSEENIETIWVSTSELTYNGETIPKDKIEICFEQYENITYKNNIKWRYQEINGYHADALLPYEYARLLGLNCLKTDNGYNQGIWFTVNVPDNQPCGEYKGEWTISFKTGQNEGNTISVPVTCYVYDFSLPDKTNNKSYFGAGWASKDMTGIDDYKANINDFLNERKISSGFVVDKANATVIKTPKEITDNIDNYATAVYNHVTQSSAPYYVFDPQSWEQDAKTPFDSFDFSLPTTQTTTQTTAQTTTQTTTQTTAQTTTEPAPLSEYMNNTDKMNEAIDKKLDEIVKVFKESTFNTASVNQTLQKIECADLKDILSEAVKKYLYFDFKYYTHTLSEDDFDYISDCDGYTEDDVNYYRTLYDVKNPNLSCPSYTQEEWIKRLYDGIMMFGGEKGILLTPDFKYKTRYCQKDWTWDETSKSYYGYQTLLQALATKSLETQTDLLKYAICRNDHMDEAEKTDFWSNYNVLAASKVLEDSKSAVRSFICAWKGNETVNYSKLSNQEKASIEQFKIQLLDSLDNLCMIVSESPTDSNITPYINRFFTNKQAPAYFAILNHGLGYCNLDQLEEDFKVFTLYNDKSVEKAEWHLSIPADFSISGFCPLVNDFSNVEQPICTWEGVAKDYDATMAALENPDLHLWWYNCNLSASNPFLMSRYIGGNIAYKEGNQKNGYLINGNSLAIARANKWQQFKLGIEGEMHWAVNNYIDINTKTKKENTEIWTELNGVDSESFMVYPIYLLLKPYFSSDASILQFIQQHGSEYFASSIRLEVYSESNDDYDYLCLANELLNKLAILDNKLPNTADVTDYAARLNKIFDSLFDDVNYDSNVTAEVVAQAKKDLAGLIVEMEYIVKTSALVFHINPRNEKNLYINLSTRGTNQTELVDAFYLDFENCTSSIGTLTKGKENLYEFILPLDDAPVTQSFIDWNQSIGGYRIESFVLKEDNLILNRSLSQTGVDECIDIVQPFIQYGYQLTEFYEYNFDVSVQNWKSSKQAISFEFKPVYLTTDTDRNQESVHFAFATKKTGSGITESCKLDLQDNSVTLGDTKYTAQPLEYGWYRLTIPCSMLTPATSNAISYSLDSIVFRWITHSMAIRNVQVVQQNGDLNGDGITDKSDVIMFQDFLSGKEGFKNMSWQAVDLNNDGILNVIDLTLLKRQLIY